MTTELSNRTLTDADIARAAAILDVHNKTRALMRLVPKAGMGSHVVTDPSGWKISITRGEVGCGDAHRFHVVAQQIGQSRDNRGLILREAVSELVLTARRGAAHIDIPDITVEQLGEFGWGRVHTMICRVVGVMGA